MSLRPGEVQTVIPNRSLGEYPLPPVFLTLLKKLKLAPRNLSDLLPTETPEVRGHRPPQHRPTSPDHMKTFTNRDVATVEEKHDRDGNCEATSEPSNIPTASVCESSHGSDSRALSWPAERYFYTPGRRTVSFLTSLGRNTFRCQSSRILRFYSSQISPADKTFTLKSK